MTWREISVVAFAAWLTLGLAIGSWLAPRHHGDDQAAYSIVSLYTPHAAEPLGGAMAGTTRLTLMR